MALALSGLFLSASLVLGTFKEAYLFSLVLFF
jgi:hypothetical protein